MANSFIYYPKCTTCQKAKKWLDDNKIDYTARDITLDTPTFDELSRWHEQKSDYPLKKFFNYSGVIYKAMGLKDNLQNLSKDEQLKLLSENCMLIKRPILISGSRVFVGFKQELWGEIL